MKKLLSVLLVMVMVLRLMPMCVGAETACTVQDNVIDIEDRTIYSLSRYYVNAVNLRISGASVQSATEDGTQIYIVLAEGTEPSAALEVSFGTEQNKCSISGHESTVQLENGRAQTTMNLVGYYSSMSSMNKTVTYTLHFSTEAPLDAVPECLTESDSVSVYSGVAAEFDLRDYFQGARSFYLFEGAQKTLLENYMYTFLSCESGTHTLVFGASNEVGDCPDTVTITITVREITSGMWLGIKTSKGSVNFVTFTDAEGNGIEGVRAVADGTEIRVTLPHDYGKDASVQAEFNLTQTDGLPFLTTKTGTSGIAADKAVNNKFTKKSTTLNNGTAVLTFYLYNATPATTSNNYTTYTVRYVVENEAPMLADGQATTVDAEILVGETYTVDLAPVFADADGDELSYSVKIDGESAEPIDAEYSFTSMLGRTYELAFFASDFMLTSEESYKVILTVKNSDVTYAMDVLLPETCAPTFYITSCFDENGKDVLGAALSYVARETADGYTTYRVSVPENISEISVRDRVCGGMAISAASESTVRLCKVQTSVLDFGDREIPGTVDVFYGAHKAEGVDGTFLLPAEGEYTFKATPQDTSTYNSATETVVLNGATDTVCVKVTYKSPKTIITTTGATAKLFKYTNNYFVYTVYEPLATVDNGDGTSTHYFATSGDLSYRVSMEGKLTKTGYLTTGNSVTVLHSDADNLPQDRVDYTAVSTNAATVGDDSVLLNINQQGHLSLAVGDTKTLKAYRAWQIITYSYQNHIIEPDFHFDILSGEDIISLTPYENQPTTNSSGNWRTLSALGEGCAVVEVTYDAIEVRGGQYDGFYGASDPARTGLFVVTVGGQKPDVDFGIACKTGAGSMTYTEEKAKPWDAEFDTLYFFGDTGELKLSPSLRNGNITEVAVSGDKGQSYTVLQANDGVYAAPIVPGNNILRVTSDCGTAYQIVRGDRISMVVKNKSNPEKPIAKGDTVSIRLVGVHTPIPKIAGTFNPGYAGNTDGESKVHLRYSFGDTAVLSTGRQYDFSLYGTTVEFTVPDGEETDFTLTDGYIGVGVIGVTGFSDDGNSHRNIPDSGSGTRDDKTTFTTRSLLPDLKVSVGMLPDGNIAPFIREAAPKMASINLGGTYALSMTRVFSDIDGDAMTYQAKVNDDSYVNIDEYYTFTPNAIGTYTICFVAKDATSESDVHTLTLTVKESQTMVSTTLDYDISANEIEGYVSISFTDSGKRVESEPNVAYPKALGTIISTKRVPFKTGDTVADVTLRLLDACGYSYQHTGTTKNGFYLGAIGDFTLRGIHYDSFGEFDAGAGSGWMITLNNQFIEYGASDFVVKSGDVIKWQYTCQLGADIGDPFYTGGFSSGKNDTKEEDKADEEEAKEEIQKEEPADKKVFTESTFADVHKEHWHYEAVKYVYENDLMQGTAQGFEPESTMTRAMLVTVLYRMAKPDAAQMSHGFADVPAGEWYSDAVAWAVESGIVSGVSATEFAPESNISREQLALIMYRFAKLQGRDVTASAQLSDFADIKDVSDWALDALKWANKTALVNGTSATTLSPKDTASRAQVAAILMRFSTSDSDEVTE